jgi:hypothetical protein
MFATTVTDRSHRHQKLQLSFGLGSALSSIVLAGFLTVVGTRRDLPIAVHAKDNGRRGIRLCLDARCRRNG